MELKFTIFSLPPTAFAAATPMRYEQPGWGLFGSAPLTSFKLSPEVVLVTDGLPYGSSPRLLAAQAHSSGVSITEVPLGHVPEPLVPRMKSPSALHNSSVGTASSVHHAEAAGGARYGG